MKKKNFFSIMASAAILFSSCLGESDHIGQLIGFCTLNNSLNESALYMDGGGVVYLSPSSISTYKEFLSKSKRFHLVLNYPEEALVEEGGVLKKITTADIVGGSYINVSRPFTITEADSRKITSNDSINDVLDCAIYQPYGGYITILTRSLWLEKGGKGIEPTVSMVFEEVKDKSNEFNLTIYNNWHSTDPSKESKQGQTDFVNSFDITSLRNYIDNTDDITLNIKVMKCLESSKAEKTVKIKYKDLIYPFSGLVL